MTRGSLLTASALLLIASLFSSPVFAAHRETPRVLQEPRGIFSIVWRFVGNLMSGVAEGRASMDPNGTDGPTSQTTSPPPEEGDGRASMDPNG